jgi:hypothetical protein
MNIPLKSVLLTCGAALATLAAAQSPAIPHFGDLDDATIENAFWHCDARATQVVLDPGEGVLCERLGDALKQRRFGGDFTRLLAWWQERKALEHARRGVAPPAAPADVAAAALEAP